MCFWSLEFRGKSESFLGQIHSCSQGFKQPMAGKTPAYDPIAPTTSGLCPGAKRPFHLQVLSDPSRDSRFGEVVLGGLISVAIYYLGNQQN